MNKIFIYKNKFLSLIMVIIALFILTSCKKEYTVTFKYDSGDIIREVTVKKGENVELPTLSPVDGYYYEWSDNANNLKNIQENMNVTATKKEVTKIVKYYIEGTLAKEETVKYSDTVTEPTVPSYYQNYHFEETITKNEKVYTYEYKLAFTSKAVTVTFNDSEGELISKKEVTYGESYDENFPTSTSEGYFYVWDKTPTELENLTSDVVVTGTLTEANKTVKYYIEGVLAKEETVKFSEMVTEPTVPSYYKDYQFTETVTKNGNDYIYEYNLTFTSKAVTVTFNDSEGELISKKEVTYGESYDENFPTSTSEGYFYVWDKTPAELKNLTSDVVVTGMLTETNKVVQYYIDGKVVKEDTVKFSQTVTAPSYPENSKNQEWKLEISLSNNVYTYKYTLEYEMMGGSITYYDGTVKLSLSPSSFVIGDEVILPTYSKEGYQFIGWYASDISLYRYSEIDTANDGDVTLYARFVSTSEKEPLVLPDTPYRFTDITKTPHSSGNGTFVYQPVLPSNAPSNSRLQYDWSTSDPSIATVSMYSSITAKSAGYCVLTATYKADPTIIINCVIRSSSDGITFATLEEANAKSLFTVTFKDKDGKVIEEQIVNKGGAAVPPTPPTYEGLAFNGWDKDFYNITNDTTITATYVTGKNDYVGKKVAIIGDSISTYQDYIPSGYDCFYPYPTADVNDVNQTWWKQAANKLGAGIFVNNSYSGSCVSAGGSSATNSDTRLATTVIGEQKPDVIIIFMGSNDCGSDYVSSQSFDSAYKVMLDKLKALCPAAEIVLCTLPKSKLYDEDDRIEYNEIILKYATEYSLKVIDFASVDLTATLVDKAHPNKDGMSLLAMRAVDDLLKEEGN